MFVPNFLFLSGLFLIPLDIGKSMISVNKEDYVKLLKNRCPVRAGDGQKGIRQTYLGLKYNQYNIQNYGRHTNSIELIFGQIYNLLQIMLTFPHGSLN